MLRPVCAWLRWLNHHRLWRWGTTRVWGWELRAPTFDRWLALRLHRSGWMGADDRRFLEAQIRPGMTVVDIGANQGLYSLLFARLAGPDGRVIAFEPDPLLYQALTENVARNRARTVQPRHAALGAQPGAMTLHRSLFNSGDNRLASKAAASGPREAVSIRVERLDEALPDERVDFIKMDVQGWELEVFRGMGRLLDDPRQAALAIYFEFWPDGLRDAGGEPLDLLRLLAAKGFAIHQPRSGEMGTAAQDLAALARSLRPGTYTNLFALRPHG